MKIHLVSSLAALAMLAATSAGMTTANAQSFATLKTLTFANFQEGGAYIDTGLTLSDGMLYGTGGTVFKVGIDGTGFAVVHRFTGGSEGWNPIGRPVVSGNTIYGVTRGGGIVQGGYEYGVLYRVNTDGSGFTVLHRFNNAGGNGYYPTYGLVLSGSTLYGTAILGGALNGGVVFKINTDGSGYHILHTFSSNSNVAADFIFSGTTLYGANYDFHAQQDPSTLFSLDLRPRLALVAAGQDLRISWPSYAHDYALEMNSTLTNTGWTGVTALPVDDGTNWQVALPIPPASPAAFHRLRR